MDTYVFDDTLGDTENDVLRECAEWETPPIEPLHYGGDGSQWEDWN